MHALSLLPAPSPQDRMNNPEWHTFAVPTKEEDQVTFLFDIMYEKHAVFRRQYWMGEQGRAGAGFWQQLDG